MVHERGLEPPRPKARAPKARVSTNSTTHAYSFLPYIFVMYAASDEHPLAAICIIAITNLKEKTFRYSSRRKKARFAPE